MTDDSGLKVLPQQLPRPRDARTLRARPEEFPLVPRETALIVVDMQNAYASPGGYIDIQGFDVSGAKRVIERMRVIGTARALVPRSSSSRTAGSRPVTNGHAGLAQLVEIERAEINACRPQTRRHAHHPRHLGLRAGGGAQTRARDIVLNKTRYSGFWGTPLDAMLRARRIRNLLF